MSFLNPMAAGRQLMPSMQAVDPASTEFKYLYSTIAVFVVAVYVSNAYSYVYRPSFLFKPLYWHVITVGLAGFAAIVYPGNVLRTFPRAMLLWIGIFWAHLSITFLYSSQTEATMQLYINGVQTAALLFSFILLLLPEADSKIIPKVLVLIVLFSVCLNLYDFIDPTFTLRHGRAAGWYENPNAAGKVIAISMVLSALAVPRKLRIAYCLAVGVGLLVTFSRASWILWTMGVAGLAATGHLFQRIKYTPAFVIAILSLVFIYALLTGPILDLLQGTMLDHYLTRSIVARLGGAGSSYHDPSFTARVEMVQYSLMSIREHPWIGGGLGATSEWLSLDRPHNLYLMLAVEAGVLGLLVFFALLGILWWQSNSVGRIAVSMYAVSSLFSHVNLANASMLCLLAIVLVNYDRGTALAQSNSP